MAENEREHRPEPERTAPNRSFAGMVRPSDPWAARDEFWHRRNGEGTSQEQAAPGDAAPTFATVARDAVDLAYKLSETYLREGRQAAESFSAQQRGGRDSLGGPFFQGGSAVNQPYGDPMVQMYGQIARAYGELMASLARMAYPWYGAFPYAAYPRPRDYRCADERSRYCSPQPCPPPSYCPPEQKPHEPHHGLRLELEVTVAQGNTATIHKVPFGRSDNPAIPMLVNLTDKTTLTPSQARKVDGLTIIPIDATKAKAGIYFGPILNGPTGAPVGVATVEIK